jgi:hypothetical protein
MTRHGGPDVSGTICWQQLAGLSRASQTLQELVQPTQCNAVSNETPSEMSVPSDKISISTIDYDITVDA